MAVILQKLVDVYKYLNYDISDPRTQDWFLMSNPFPGLAIIGVYLYVIFDWGPKMMAKREAYTLKHTLVVYNIFQIFISAYTVYESLVLGWFNNYKLVCEPVIITDDPVAMKIAWRVCYLYFLIKIVDLLDTVFFVMRKKMRQVSFLHVYHHAGMVALSWSIVKWLPGGHGVMVITINSLIHTIMYTYYLLAVGEGSEKYMWWKKYVTQLQIVQFGFLLFYLLLVFIVEDCQYPKMPSFFLVPQNLFLVILFTDFYIKSYHKKSKA